jgi:hypothetical protein
MLSMSYPGTLEVKAIVAIGDAVIRNLSADGYARLLAAIRSHVGEHANWCTFATWASRQAGCTIRGEDLGDRLKDIAQLGWRMRDRSVARGAHCSPRTLRQYQAWRNGACRARTV